MYLCEYGTSVRVEIAICWWAGGAAGVAEVLRRARAGADAVRHAGGGRGRLAAQRHLPPLHAHQQAGRLVLAGAPSNHVTSYYRTSSRGHWLNCTSNRDKLLITQLGILGVLSKSTYRRSI